jgi:glycerophosphoryl diester phosphodiesterase
MKRKYYLICSSIILCCCLVAQQKPQVIAHRGFWQSKGAAQNTIASLESADRIKVYGSEFDVRMTRDSVLVIIHDETINNIRIEEAPYAAIQDIVLSNGEKIPTLREFLEAGRHLKTAKLILELKIGKKDNPAWNCEAARRTVALVREKKLQLQTEYITFDLEAAKELIRLAPESDVYYLNGDLAPKELKSLGFAGLDYHFDVMKKNPQWFREAKALGLGINVWTVNDVELIREMIENGADFITTDIPADVIKMISNAGADL